jgi:hypothetical protein
MSIDKTVRERIARYTARMLQCGAMRVYVWVPSEDDAKEIRLIAAAMRARARDPAP